MITILILEDFSGLGRTAFISSDDIRRWDNRWTPISGSIELDKDVELLKKTDCIMFISSLPFQALPKEIRNLFGEEVKPRARVWRYRLKEVYANK